MSTTQRQRITDLGGEEGISNQIKIVSDEIDEIQSKSNINEEQQQFYDEQRSYIDSTQININSIKEEQELANHHFELFHKYLIEAVKAKDSILNISKEESVKDKLPKILIPIC